MITRANIQEARWTGSITAARELARLQIDESQPIDVFNIIETSKIWLLFKPLDGPMGLYLKNGILINNGPPKNVQRFTAAHEYGHHVLGHRSSLDLIQDIEPSAIAKSSRYTKEGLPYITDDQVLEEAAALSFAADFLMPSQLVHRLWNELRLPKDSRSIEAWHIYLLSLFVGVSYRATLCQLAALSLLTPYKANQLYNLELKQIKQSIGGTPRHPWADVWPIDASFSGQTLQVAVQDELRIRLPEAPSTGYIWIREDESLTAVQDSNVFHLPSASLGEFFDDSFERHLFSHGQAPIGGGGVRHLAYRVTHPGNYPLRIVKCRPWQSNSAIETFELQLVATGSRTGTSEHGLSENLKSLLAA